MGRILIADDHDAIRRGLVRGLIEAGHEVEEASNGNAAIERLHDNYFDVVLSDLKMGGSDGMDVLRTTRALHPTTAVILMTAFGTVNTAVEAMKIGAFDYVQKPFEIEEMEVKIEKALEVKRLKNEIEYLRDAQQDRYDFDHIIGNSPPLQRVLDIVRKVAKSNTTVLVRGETGTGKELIVCGRPPPQLAADIVAELREGQLARGAARRKPARVRALRPRKRRVHGRRQTAHRPVRTGGRRHAVPRRNRRHEPEHPGQDPARAAGTRVRARLGGTRTLRVDVRLVAATNRDLSAMVATGLFREDLYYRLNVVSIEMPPLRERKDDIVPLANTFIRKFSAELKKKIDGLEPDAQKLLMRYNWPGNIRELENTIERAMLLAEGRAIVGIDLRLGEAPTMGGRQGATSRRRSPFQDSADGKSSARGRRARRTSSKR